MSIRTKFTIVSAGFLFPIGLLMFFFITTRNEKILFAQKEIDGNHHLQYVYRLIPYVFQHKLIAVRLSNSADTSSRLRAEFDATADSIETTLAAISRTAKQFGDTEKIMARYRALTASWQALKSKTHSASVHFSEAESNDAHTAIIAQVQNVIVFVGDQSNLILDTDLDSYYLVDLTLLQMPERENILHQIMMLGERTITNHKHHEQDSSENNKLQMAALLALLNANISKCANDYQSAFENNPIGNLKPALENFSGQRLAALRNFASFVEVHFIKHTIPQSAAPPLRFHPIPQFDTISQHDTLSITVEQFLAACTKAIVISNEMWNLDAQYLDELLANRINATKKELYVNIGIIIVVLLLTAILAGYILSMIVRSIRALSLAASRVSNGDLTVRTTLPGDDELFGLGQMFNAMVESLQSAFVEVEQEQLESARLAQEAAQEIKERQKTEEALKQEKEKAEQYLRVAEVIFVAFDTEAHIMLLNRKGYEVLEYEEGELNGKDWFKVCLPSEEFDAVSEVYKRIIAGETELFEYHENQILTKTGKKRHIAWHNSVLRDTDGAIIGTFSSGEDITERRQAEAALHTSEERFRTLSEAAFEGVLIHENGIIRNVNRAFATLFGISNPNDLIGKNGFEVLSLTPKSREIIREQARTNSAAIREIDVVRPDGSIYPAEQQGRDIFYDGRKMRVVVMRDITERKQAEDALKKLIVMSDTALQLTQAGYWQYHLDDPHHYTSSEQTIAIFGDFPTEGYQYRVIEDWYANLMAGDKEYAEKTLKNFNDAIAGIVEMYDSIYAYKRPVDGRIVWIHAVGKVVRNEEGTITGMVGVSQDITEFKRVEEEINELNRTLEQRVLERTRQLENTNKELEAFSYSVSHDLRAPLRGIDGWSLALLEDYGEQLDATAKQYLDRVRSETQRMGHLIDDILRLSVITRAEMKLATVNLSALASVILERLQEMYSEKEFIFVVQPELYAAGDANLLEIMLTNLLGNACKFASKKPSPKIEFGTTLDAGKQTYFIRDNGVGFNKESAKNLFGAFQRMHKQSEFPGTGIGLATVQRIINRHQGSVWVEAAVDQGATFYFTLDSTSIQ